MCDSRRVSKTTSDAAPVAGELRVVLGRLMRRLRAEHGFSLAQGAVLGRLDREGPQSVSDLAGKEKMRPQSMAQTVADLEGEGLVERNPDPDDRRRALISLTRAGVEFITDSRQRREGWLVRAIEELPDEDRETMERAVVLLGRLADAEL